MEPGRNHFELFGLPVAYEVDTAKLAETYRELQRVLHPDRYANASDRERRLSVQQAAQVNEAYQTLRSPLRRARYLLELRGVEFDDERQTHLDPEFLMAQMELREALAAVRGKDDPFAALNAFLAELDREQAALEAQLAERLAGDTPDDREAARQLVQKLQFFARLREEAEEVEESLLD